MKSTCKFPVSLGVLLLALLMPAPLQATTPIGDVSWHEGGYNSAVRRARSEGKLLFIALVPDWSDYSVKMVAESLPDPTVTPLLADMVCLKYEQEDARSLQVARLYKVTSFPTLVVAGSDGKIQDVIIGYFPPAPLVSELQRIQSGQGTLGDHLQRVAAAPDDLAVRYAYAVKLDELGDAAGFQRELDVIRTTDPAGETLIGALIHQNDVWAAIAAAAPGGEVTFDLTPIYEFMPTVQLPVARFQGWGRIANFQVERERRAEAVDAFRQAAPDVPDAQQLDWNGQVVEYVLEADQGDLPPETGAFVLELAEAVVERAQLLGEADADGNIAYQPEDNEGESYEAWLAGRLDLLTRCQMKYPDRARIAKAIATCKRSIELDPGNPEYKSRLAMLRERR